MALGFWLAQAQLRSALANIDSAQRTADAATETAANNAVAYEIAINQAAATEAQRKVQESTACQDDSSTSVCQSAKASTSQRRHPQQQHPPEHPPPSAASEPSANAADALPLSGSTDSSSEEAH